MLEIGEKFIYIYREISLCLTSIIKSKCQSLHPPKFLFHKNLGGQEVQIKFKVQNPNNNLVI